MDIAPGASVGIFGESGSGKSTLLMSIPKLLSADAISEGSVVFGGRNLLTANERELQHIRGAELGLVIQESGTALNPVRKVGEQVAEVLRAHCKVSRRASREEALGALASVGLQPRTVADSWPHQLSGGQLQRVLLAQALICRPGLLLADEPTHSLDSRTRTDIARLIRERVDRLGMALLIASHDPEILRITTDYLVVIYAGQIIEAGRTSDILDRPLHPFTSALVHCTSLRPRQPGTLPLPFETIPGNPAGLDGPSGGCRFASRCFHRRAGCSEVNPALLPIMSNREVRCVLYD